MLLVFNCYPLFQYSSFLLTMIPVSYSNCSSFLLTIAEITSTKTKIRYKLVCCLILICLLALTFMFKNQHQYLQIIKKILQTHLSQAIITKESTASIFTSKLLCRPYLVISPFFSFCNKKKFLEKQNNANQDQTLKMALRPKDDNYQDPIMLQKHHGANEDNYQFQQQYRKIFASAYFLCLQHRELSDSKDKLWKKLPAYDKRAELEFPDKMRKRPAERKKGFRRAASEIEKKYHCDSESCNRSYDTEGSLLQHVKLKHPSSYQEAFRSLRLQQDFQQSSESEQID